MKLLFLRGRKIWKRTLLTQALLAGWSIKSVRPACSVLIQGRSSHPQLHLLLSLQGTWEPRGSHGAAQEELQRSAFPPLLPTFKGLRAKSGFPVLAIAMVHWGKGLFSEKVMLSSQLTSAGEETQSLLLIARAWHVAGTGHSLQPPPGSATASSTNFPKCSGLQLLHFHTSKIFGKDSVQHSCFPQGRWESGTRQHESNEIPVYAAVL